MEKAHDEVINLFLQILDEGKLTDNFGRETDFTNCLIILTGNVGAHHLVKSSNVGFNSPDLADTSEKVKDEAKKFFTAEFLNRLDGVLVFNSFTKSDIQKITEMELSLVKDKLAEKKIGLSIDNEVAQALVEKTLDLNCGARPLQRLIHEKIESLIAMDLVDGSLKKGDFLRIVCQNNKFFIEKS